MRQISNAALAKIVETEGTEPITLVQIFWDADQSVIYGDRAFVPGIRGQLLDVGEINNVINASEGSNSGSVNIRLDDKDGTLKTIFNTMDIHKRPVYILQWFPQLPLADAFIVFDGVISSPIEWNEGERTLSFEVLSKIEDLEVGYSAEEGNFEYIPSNVVGQAWPLVFGKVIKLPCIQINESPTGASLDDLGTDSAGDGEGPIRDIVDNERRNLTLLEELERQCFTMAAILLGQATSLDSESVTSRANATVGLTGGGTLVQGAGIGLTGGDTSDATIPLSGSLARRSDNPVAQQLYDLGTQYEQLGNQYREERLRPFNTGLTGTPEQQALNRNQIRVAGGSSFPQKTNVIIRINGVVHEGYFEGDIFTIVSSTTPFADQGAVAGPTRITDRAVATEFQTDLAVSSFFYSIAGSSVSIAGGSYPIWYIVGIPFLTDIVVFGEKTTTGSTKYTLPSSWYTVHYKTFGTLQATFIQMHVPLSSRDGDWTDNIWVNCTSPLGPNAVDILEYLIENYTNQSIDSTTFAEVRSLVNPYKCNFALTERKGAMQVLEEVAYQSRCAIWFKGGRFYLKYLPKQYAPVDSITEDDVESGTMQVFGTETEDIVTKWSISWREQLDKTKPNKIVYRYNIKKYGLIESEYDCYIYNAKASVQKFAQFWLIRKANTWKKVTFSTFMTKLRLEPFDSVLIDFAFPWVNDPGCVNPTVGIVEEASYDSDTHRIRLTIWLPIRFGEMCPYDFAYPSELDTTFIFPQENDPGTQTDVPGSGAEGPLYDQTPHTGPGGLPGTTPQNSGFSGDTIPSDATDAGNPRFDPPVALAPNELVNTQNPPSATQVVSQRLIKPIDTDTINVPDAVFPGFVVKLKNAETREYEVDVYLNGMAEAPKRMFVKQLALHADDKLPPNAPCMVSRNVQRNSENLVSGVEYTMQVPIWLAPATEAESVEPPQLPPADPGSSPEPAPTVPPQSDEGDQ